ncbi:Uncharacterised protein [Mycobacteroides abscessus subsp. abscessus]|nr:Uncharacterised protein [Mycobacteroides abscessus subsp. abscessus]
MVLPERTSMKAGMLRTTAPIRPAFRMRFRPNLSLKCPIANTIGIMTIITRTSIRSPFPSLYPSSSDI